MIKDVAVAKNDISAIKSDISEIKELLKSQDSRYVSRNELKVTQWVFGAIISALALWLNLSDHLK